MNILLDTNILIWFINGDTRLSSISKELIRNTKNNCFISIASIWEIAIKISLKKLELNDSFSRIKELLLINQFQVLHIEFEHLTFLLNLNYFHKDPFDRIIISQAIVEHMPIITSDKCFDNYPINVIF